MTSQQDLEIPVITIDGGAGTGKGTMRNLVAEKLKFHQLDSGLLYRVVAWRCLKSDVKETKEIIRQAQHLNVLFERDKVFFHKKDITDVLRSPEVSIKASAVAKIPEIREVLLLPQRKTRRTPGLVADGRDMAYIFEGNVCRISLETKPEVRALWRFNQYQHEGYLVSYDEILRDIIARDKEDMGRKNSPLVKHFQAKTINTTEMNIPQVVERILEIYSLHNLRKKKS